MWCVTLLGPLRWFFFFCKVFNLVEPFLTVCLPILFSFGSKRKWSDSKCHKHFTEEFASNHQIVKKICTLWNCKLTFWKEMKCPDWKVFTSVVIRNKWYSWARKCWLNIHCFEFVWAVNCFYLLHYFKLYHLETSCEAHKSLKHKISAKDIKGVKEFHLVTCIYGDRKNTARKLKR